MILLHHGKRQRETLIKALPRRGGEQENLGNSTCKVNNFDADLYKSAFPKEPEVKTR